MSCNSSPINYDAYSRDDPLYWSLPTPVNCNVVRITGICLCLCGFIGTMLNGALMSSFIRYKHLRTPSNIFIMFLSGIGLLGSFSTVQLTGVSSTYCRWVFGRLGCQTEAFMAFLYGCSSAYLLCAVSLTRCYIIIRPFNAKDITVHKCLIIAIISVLLALMWTTLPILGWNEYTIEGSRTSCCVNMYDRRLSYILYNSILFIFVYLIPLIILLVTNTTIYIGLKRMKDKVAHGGKADLSNRKIEMERRILKSIIITVCGFICTWTPYAIVFFLSVFHGHDARVNPLASFICACFAKTSVMWIPILYIATSTYFKFSFLDVNSSENQRGASQNTATGANASIENKSIKQTISINPTIDNDSD